jgi:glutamate-1-semialdehyde 2,1-aminomutase
MGKVFDEYLKKEIERYVDNRPNSKKCYERACKVLPGGDTRTATYFYPFPHFIAYGYGAYMTDVDGNRLLDFQNNYTSLIHGHGDKDVVEAVRRQVEMGTAFTAPFEMQTKLSEILVNRFPGIDLIRFTNSGTEANMHALRIARAYTGKAKIIKTEGGYHGTTDVFEASVDPNIKKAGSLDNIKVIPESRGVSSKALEDVIVVPFNDIERTKAAIEKNHEDVACLIIEPIMGSAGQITPDIEYLRFLRDITREYGILLIFDEVVMARLTTGGAQKFYGITPDLTTLGKIIGGGTPIGAFGGKEEIMKLYDPREKKMYHSGTFNGNALGMAAGVAAMEKYDENAVKKVNELGNEFKQGLLKVYERLGLNIRVSGEGSIYNIIFKDEDVKNYRDVASSHEELNKLLFISLLNKGVFDAERGMFCMSTAMERSDIHFGLNAVEEALKDMRGVISAEAPELI